MEKLNKYVSLVMIILLICGNIATANAQSIKDVYEEAIMVGTRNTPPPTV